MKVWVLYYHNDMELTTMALHLTEIGALQNAVDWLCADFDNYIEPDEEIEKEADRLWSSRMSSSIKDLKQAVKWFEKQLTEFKVYCILHHEGVLP